MYDLSINNNMFRGSQIGKRNTKILDKKETQNQSYQRYEYTNLSDCKRRWCEWTTITVGDSISKTCNI